MLRLMGREIRYIPIKSHSYEFIVNIMIPESHVNNKPIASIDQHVLIMNISFM
jgi:hypothetical protein